LRIDFRLGRYESEEDDGSRNLLYDYDDATVVYNSLIEEDDEIEIYKKRFNTKRLRLIKKDLPLVGYSPYLVSRDLEDSWFFFLSSLLRNRQSLSLGFGSCKY
jgi:hypothetical protein